MPNTKSNTHAPPLFSSSGTYFRYLQRREMYLRPDWQSVVVTQYIISTTTSTLSSNVSQASLLCLGFDKMFKEYIFFTLADQYQNDALTSSTILLPISFVPTLPPRSAILNFRPPASIGVLNKMAMMMKKGLSVVTMYANYGPHMCGQFVH